MNNSDGGDCWAHKQGATGNSRTAKTTSSNLCDLLRPLEVGPEEFCTPNFEPPGVTNIKSSAAGCCQRYWTPHHSAVRSRVSLLATEDGEPGSYLDRLSNWLESLMRRDEKSVDLGKNSRHETLFLLCDCLELNAGVVLFTSPHCHGAQLFRQKFWRLSATINHSINFCL